MKLKYFKKIIVFVCINFISASYFAQALEEQGHNNNFWNETKNLRKAKDFDKIINILHTKLEIDTIKAWHYYQLACYYSLTKDTALAFEYIKKSIDMHIQPEDFLSDFDFENLHDTKEWEKIKDTLITIHLARYPNIKNKNLSVKLWLMGIEDQKPRLYGYKIFPDEPQKTKKLRDKEFYEQYINNTKFVKNLVDTNYWAIFSDVGERSGLYTMLIVQHSEDINLFKKSLALLEQHLEDNEITSYMYALMLDRYLVKQNQKQIYGSQLLQKTILWKQFPLVFYPIEDEKNVNSRIEKMGLGTIEKLAEKHGIKYEYNPIYENMPFKKALKMKLHRKF